MPIFAALPKRGTFKGQKESPHRSPGKKGMLIATLNKLRMH
jgi:hypothetical protein